MIFNHKYLLLQRSIVVALMCSVEKAALKMRREDPVIVSAATPLQSFSGEFSENFQTNCSTEHL